MSRSIRVERVLFDGRHTVEWLPPFEAALEAVASPQNGVTVARLRLRWGDKLDEWTRSA